MDPNFILTGDEARILMTCLATSEANVPANKVIKLWGSLNEINFAQPHIPEPQPQVKNER